MKTKIIAITLAIAACCHPTTDANAQRTYELTLEEAIEIARTDSYSMKALEQDLIIAENTMEAAIRRLRTNVALSATIPNYSEAVREWEDSEGKVTYYSARQLRMGTDLTVSQPLPTDGQLSLETGLSGLDDYNNDMRAAQMDATVRLYQPLDAFWGFNNIRSELKTARLNHERAQKAYKRAELDLVYNVSQSYYNLLQRQRATEIARMDMERQAEVHDISKKKYEAGLIREVESLQMEVDLANSQNAHDGALLDLDYAEKTFKLLLGLDLADRVSVRTEELNYEPIAVDPDRAVQLALAGRLEMRERDINIEVQGLAIRQQKAVGRPTLALDASWSVVGVSNEALATTYPNSINYAWANIKSRPTNFAIGINLRIPILDWGRNRRLVRVAEARQVQNHLAREDQQRSIETEVRTLVAQLQSYLSRLQLLEKNVALAEKSFAITLERFSNGDITSDGLAEERRRLNLALDNHLSAYVQYQLGLADLTRTTFFDFRRDRPVE